MSYFCVYPVFRWDNIAGKVLPKAEGLEKIYKRGWGDGHIEGGGGVVYRRGRSNHLHTMLFFFL